MRILFYVEPVSFKRDHLFLSPLMNVIRCIINANRRDDVSYGLASSSGLLGEYDRWLAHGGLVSIYRKVIHEREVLRNFDFNHIAYAQALFSEGANIAPLEEVFSQIEEEFSPDIIVCFTQNSAIEQLSTEKLTLFAERGPLPRWSSNDNFYFEPCGHQRQSIIARKTSEVKAFGVDMEQALAAAEKFRQIHTALPARKDAIFRFRRWLDTHRAGRKVAIVANQPHDSLLIAGAAGGVSLDSYVMATLDALPEGWCAFCTYHTDMGDCSKLDQRISEAFPNFMELPLELRQFGSDIFVDEADALITIGSKAAFPAALLGKKIVANPATMLAGLSTARVQRLDEARALTDAEAGCLLAFLSHRFTLSNEDLFQKDGFWLRHIEALLHSRSYDDFFLDTATYQDDAIDRMFGRLMGSN